MKKTILLVDDQREVLLGIREFLSEMQMTDAEILMAQDGRQGLALALERRPNVIVADIMMPELDGLSMVQEIVSAGLHSRIIVLSAYSEFDFARKAIALGVNEYLVKPVTQRQICNAVMRQLNSVGDAASYDRFCGLMLGSYLSGNDFYTRPQDVMELTGLSRMKGGFWRAALLDASAADGEALRAALTRPSQIERRLFAVGDGLMLLVLNADDEAALTDSAAALTKALSADFPDVTGGMSAVGRGLESLPVLYRQARAALSIAGSEERPWQVEQALPGGDTLISDWELKAVAQAIAGKPDDSEVWLRVDEMLARLTLSDASARDKCVSLTRALGELCAHFGCADQPPELPYDDRRSLFHLKQHFIETVQKLVQRESQPGFLSPIRRATKYINQHYAEDCSVAFLANYADLSYSYFSAMFTRVMGMSATEYVLDVRLTNARRMLEQAQDRRAIGEIAARCGFETPRYFSTCFKRRFGVSPSAYATSGGLSDSPQ